MAWFTYKCTKCGEEFRVSLDERKPTVQCIEPVEPPNIAPGLKGHGFTEPCMGEAKPILKGGNVKIVEKLDNGAMVRSVERLHNVEEILQERSDAHSVANDDQDQES